MVISANTTDKKYNYFDFINKQFIFNNHKTSKLQKEPLIINIPENLMRIIDIYLKHHPKRLYNNSHNFLVNYDGSNIDKVNSITRILNKIFNKKISSSMLRHIYLSSKYKDVLEEQKKDSILMSHNMQTQKDYIKN
jgi:integrase